MQGTDLNYFKDLLLERQIQIKKNIHDVLKELNELRDMEVNDDCDYVSLSIDDLRDSAMSRQQEAELKEIEDALKKIKKSDTHTYGVCEMCEEQIGIHRLKVKPHAKYCIVCRKIHEKNPT